jgi:hypothetical protein
MGTAGGTPKRRPTRKTMVLAIVLAFFFGYALTLYAVTRAGVGLKTAIGVALAADTLSITIMEIVDNGVLLVVPGRWRRTCRMDCSGGRWPSPSPWRSWSPPLSTSG